jgi:hypothetical protein
MNMDMDMDTSILENILNITPSGVIVGSDTFGVVDIDMDIDIDIDEDADIDSEIDDAFFDITDSLKESPKIIRKILIYLNPNLNLNPAERT